MLTDLVRELVDKFQDLDELEKALYEEHLGEPAEVEATRVKYIEALKSHIFSNRDIMRAYSGDPNPPTPGRDSDAALGLREHSMMQYSESTGDPNPESERPDKRTEVHVLSFVPGNPYPDTASMEGFLVVGYSGKSRIFSYRTGGSTLALGDGVQVNYVSSVSELTTEELSRTNPMKAEDDLFWVFQRGLISATRRAIKNCEQYAADRRSLYEGEQDGLRSGSVENLTKSIEALRAITG